MHSVVLMVIYLFRIMGFTVICCELSLCVHCCCLIVIVGLAATCINVSEVLVFKDSLMIKFKSLSLSLQVLSLSLSWSSWAWSLSLHVQSLLTSLLHGIGPEYFSEDFRLVCEIYSRQRLHSASSTDVVVPATRRSSLGGCAFPVAGARVWNALLPSVTSTPSLSSFRRLLKTFLNFLFQRQLRQ